MNTTSSTPVGNRFRFPILLLIAAIGVSTGILISKPLGDPGYRLSESRPVVVAVPTPPVEDRPRSPSLDEVKRTACERARRHLELARQESDRQLADHLQSLNRFFRDAKKNTPTFTEDALCWGSKWRLAVDALPWGDRTRHERYLREKFEQHIFSPAQLEAAVRQVIRSYLDHQQAIENRMLVLLQADLSNLPAGLTITTLSNEELQPHFNEAIRRAQRQAVTQLQADVAGELISLVTGEVLTMVAVRLGVSAGILGSGAATGWATLGVGVVVGLIVDQIVSWVWDWWADPKGELTRQLDGKLDELHRLIVEGDGKGKGLRSQMARLARERGALREKAVLDLVQQTGGSR